MKSRTIYLTLIFVTIFCIGAVGYANNAIVTVVAVPAATLAMLGAFIQWFRDELSFGRSSALQALQQSHAIGTTSHMAMVAFNKHVSFCEEYVVEMQNAFRDLFHTGPSEEALASAGKLFNVRQKSVLWITRKMATDLQKFETALQVIGAKAHWIDVEPDHPNRSAAIGEMYSLFAEVMGMPPLEDGPISEERAYETIIQKLREVLGIDELTELRAVLVTQALKSARV